MKEKIYESDNWIVQRDDGKLIISFFDKGHYKDEIVLNIKNEIKISE